MNSDEAEQYLKDHPEQFARLLADLLERQPGLLDSMQVPHPYGGRAIPLSERQTLGLREKVKLLEGKLAELIQFGEENDAISEKVHRVSSALLGAKNFAAVVHALYFHLREDFSVPHVALRLWGQSLLDGTLEGAPVTDEQRTLVDTMGAPQCGPAEGSPFLPWFRESAEHVRSIALIPLGSTKAFGMLALGSEDPQRFYPEMGTLYLRRIGELAAAALSSRL
ncbi:MAG: DUF484 family protein [Betaproteobacteria bacterium]|nr:DUF484 family protein [Betaproteobacteria bacterium]